MPEPENNSDQEQLQNSLHVVILGRPNVGKSSLFNRLTAGKAALVAAESGMTRDLRWGSLRPPTTSSTASTWPHILIADTPGLEDQTTDQALWHTIRKCNLVLLVTDASSGPTGLDEELLTKIRQCDTPALLTTNKADLSSEIRIKSDFAPLGLTPIMPVSALQGRGINRLRQQIQQSLVQGVSRSADNDELPDMESVQPTLQKPRRVILLGRPNAGKSTLMNLLCGKEYSKVSAEAGTTRDEVRGLLTNRNDHTSYQLIDTAGIQKRWRWGGKGQAIAAARALFELEKAELAILLIDARVGVAEQDCRLAGTILSAGVPAVLALSKSDLLNQLDKQTLRTQMHRRLAFATDLPTLFISASKGSGIKQLRSLINRLTEQQTTNTAMLNRTLQKLLEQHAPPSHNGRRPKLRYAHPMTGSKGPLHVRILGTGCERIPLSYHRYLEKGFGRAVGGPYARVKIILESTANPYAPGHHVRKNQPAKRTRR